LLKRYKKTHETTHIVDLLIKIKRVYDLPSQDDGFRILVDRLWPRGMSKEKAKLDFWMKDIAPSEELRTWFNHESIKWEEFNRKYKAELSEKHAAINQINQLEREKGVITLVYSAKDAEHNNAIALRSILECK
jgi:uncharacterized protein YeaO (DUF488 family)